MVIVWQQKKTEEEAEEAPTAARSLRKIKLFLLLCLCKVRTACFVDYDRNAQPTR